MLTPAEQEEVLQRGIRSGLIRGEQIADPANPPTLPQEAAELVLRYGPRLAELVVGGQVSEATIADLVQQVRLAAIDQTAPPVSHRESAPASPTSKADTPAPPLAQVPAAAEATPPPVELSSPWLADETSDALADAPTPVAPASASGSNPYLFPVQQWERYEFIKLLGRGGMGAVYQARDRRIGRMVALKFLHAADEHMVRRFMQEARAQSRVDHPGVGKVLEVGEVAGKVYIAMQYVDGQALHQASPTLSINDKARLIKEAAEALHAAHQLEIIHREV